MRNTLIFLFITLMIGCGSESSVTVTEIISGNQIVLNHNMKVTLAGVENNDLSKDYLLSNIKGNQYTLKVDKITSDGMDLYIYLSERNNHSVNHYILSNGLSKLNTTTCGDSISIYSNFSNVKEPAKVNEDPNELITEKGEALISDVIDEISDNVFLIINYDENGNEIGIGTGFFLDNNGTAVSNYHVFEGGANWKIKMKGNNLYNVINIFSYDEDNDFLIFKVDLKGRVRKGIKISDQKANLGDDIYVLGNPKGLETTLSKGIVSSLRSEYNLIQIDAAISPGSSGSPVLNKYGRVIGLATFQRVNCENCNFAVDINLVQSELRQLK